MQEILDRYSNSDSEYLLSIITSEHANERNRYRNRLGFVNNKLKEIGKMLGLSTTLTMYVARHSWASVAKNN
ncbi:MAG: site-specific integrase, partial [Rikenellaceae bacterium]